MMGHLRVNTRDNFDLNPDVFERQFPDASALMLAQQKNLRLHCTKIPLTGS